MNQDHARICQSPEWAEFMQTRLLPSFLTDIPLGPDLLELGPGPGASTQWLSERVERLTVLEIEDDAAEALRKRFAETNVTVLSGDATDMPLDDASFDTVAAFTMLHHVAGFAAQNRLFAEALRVLRPGGALVGSDSLASERLRRLHDGDLYFPVEPGTLLTRLQTIGFGPVTLIVDGRLKFVARKPGPDDEQP